MAEAVKDFPLLLRRRRNGALELSSEQFPPRHEFSLDWLLENSDVVEMDSETIRLHLANGTATYRIARELMERSGVIEDEAEAQALNKQVGDEHTWTLSAGYWGVLVDQEVKSRG